MGLLKKDTGCLVSSFFVLLQDVGNFKKNYTIKMELFDDALKISAPMIKGDVSLKYSQITDVFYGLDTEVIEKDKSSIGRAIAGGLIFGGTGAIVGAVSGMGKKTKKISKFLLVISYKASDETEQFLQFEAKDILKGKKLSTILKEKCNIQTSQNDKRNHVNL